MQVCVSSPGKVLLSGGYLVLDQTYSGTVLAVDTRFRSRIEQTCPSLESNPPVVLVHSPQISPTPLVLQLQFGNRIFVRSVYSFEIAPFV